MLVFVLVLALFPSAPAYMGKPIQTAARTFDSAEACIAAGRAIRAKLAPAAEARYVGALCVAVPMVRDGKEGA